MAAYNDWCRPVGDQSWYILHYNRFPKHSTIQNIADSSVRAFPHLLKTKFCNPCFIWRNGSTLNTNTAGLNSIGCINGNLVVCFVPVLHSQIKVLYIQFQIRNNQFIFNKFPDNPGHFITIQLYHRICYFNFGHCILFAV